MATLTYTRALLDLDGLDPRVQLCDAYLYGAPVVCDMASAKVFNEYMAHRQTKTGRVRNVWRVTNVRVITSYVTLTYTLPQHCDAVTTLLPMLGDDPLYPHTTSLFAYAHLGSEVKMRAGSGTSIIVDNYCTPGVQARVVSVQEQLALERQRRRDEGFGSDVETEVEGQGGAVDGYTRREGEERVGYGMSEQRRNAATAGQGQRKRRVRDDGVPWWIAMLEYVPLAGRMVSHFPGELRKSL